MKKGFTLVELLMVLGIIAIIAIVVLITLNPAELLRQGRDASRTTNLNTLNKAIGLYYSGALSNPGTLFMGSTSVIYVSVPDTSSTACADLGMPSLPTGWQYHCAPPSTYQKVNGTGWIPINFNAYDAGNVISSIPVDPVNSTSTNLYYTYETDGNGGYKVSTFFESQKYAPQMAKDGGGDFELFEKGPNLALISGRGLTGYWPFNDSQGTTAIDYSGNNDNGYATGTIGWLTSGGKASGGAATFNGLAIVNPITGYFAVSSTPPLQITGSFTATAWIQTSSTWNALYDEGILSKGITYHAGATTTPFVFLTTNDCTATSSPGTMAIYLTNASGVMTYQRCGKTLITAGNWYFVAVVYNAATPSADLYMNGTLDDGTVELGTTPPSPLLNATSSPVNLGTADEVTNNDFDGSISDLRLYNRALSAAEIQEMYYATK